MRISRLLIILGPASVLYAWAARASSDVASAPLWWVAGSAFLFALTPLMVAGARSIPSGASRLALMGVSLGLALASARSGDLAFEHLHEVGWLVAVAIMLDLVLAGATRPAIRYAALGGLLGAGIAAELLVHIDVAPESTFAALVAAGVLTVGALHQVFLAGRGHPIEGALSGLALVGLAIGLAYAWLGPLPVSSSATLELLVATLLWSGHLAWVDRRWRFLRRMGVPVLAASGLCFLLLYTVAPQPLERWQLGLVGLSSGVLWWLTFSVARRVSSRAAWSMPDRMSNAIRAATRNLVGSASIEEVAGAVLAPLSDGYAGADSKPELWTLEPPLRITLDPGGRVSPRSAQLPHTVLEAVFAQHAHEALDLVDLQSRVVREPTVRALTETLQARSMGLVVPCARDGHIEGLLLLPLGERSEALSRVDCMSFGALGALIAAALGSALAEQRAEARVQRLSALHREAERRVARLQGEVEQLRGQCHVLGRGLAEDQSFHVAYSPSMRRVQTRAIELAPLDDPVLLVAPAGAPLLPVSRFIHDRGPRWQAPFVVADCSAASPDEVMSLLFGSATERYEGWFHSATGGTLVLQDLPALSMSAQARLAAALGGQLGSSESRGLPENMAPPRILATSRISRSELLARKALDSDLAAALAGASLVIPPLRERREDVPSLVLLAIDRAVRVLAAEPVGIGQDAMEALVEHDWLGDVAELELVVALAVAKATTKTISLRDLPRLAQPEDTQDESLDGTYLEVECRLLERALLRAGGNKSEAARMLGLKRTTFLDKLRRHDLEHRTPQDLERSVLG